MCVIDKRSYPHFFPSRECPEVCREAVSSLMFAAARFSDLPELRDLRDAFQERYGNSIEHSVNQMVIFIYIYPMNKILNTSKSCFFI